MDDRDEWHLCIGKLTCPLEHLSFLWPLSVAKLSPGAPQEWSMHQRLDPDKLFERRAKRDWRELSTKIRSKTVSAMVLNERTCAGWSDGHIGNPLKYSFLSHSHRMMSGLAESCWQRCAMSALDALGFSDWLSTAQKRLSPSIGCLHTACKRPAPWQIALCFAQAASATSNESQVTLETPLCSPGFTSRKSSHPLLGNNYIKLR